VAAAAGMFIGFLWYGVLFEGPWSEAVGITSEGENYFKRGEAVTLSPTLPMVINAVAMVFYAIFFSWLTARADATSFTEGAVLGAILGVVVSFTHYVTNRFAMEPTSLSVIDGSYHIVLFAAISAIVGGWRK
ncbi:MAG: DUF1761 domain-containing protein, partial [Bacteroidota bacterium]